MSHTEQMREAFERYMSDDGEFPKAVERSGDGYRLLQSQNAWVTWKACASALTAPATEASDDTLQAIDDAHDWQTLVGRMAAYRDVLALRPAPAAEVPEAMRDADQREWDSAVRTAGYGLQGRVPVNGSTLLAVNVQLQSTRLRGGVPQIDYTPGTWYEAKDRDDLQAFFLSRLPVIREAAREHGYAIGLHGSLRRDMDLIAVPWRDGASDKDVLAHAIAMAACGITRDGPYQWEAKPLGRVAASLPCCWPSWFNEAGAGHIDLSVMGPLTAAPQAPALDAGVVRDAWQPIETAPKDKFILVCCPSGYRTTPLVFTTAIMHSDYKQGRWVDHANDDLSDWGMEPTHWWMYLPAAPQAPALDISQAARDVLAERQRQISAEGWTPEHDDEHGDGSMAMAAAAYAVASIENEYSLASACELFSWSGWAKAWWKPSTPRRDLIKAGALILAEIERLDRAAISAQAGDA